jgi:hypothetical protein
MTAAKLAATYTEFSLVERSKLLLAEPMQLVVANHVALNEFSMDVN